MPDANVFPISARSTSIRIVSGQHLSADEQSAVFGNPQKFLQTLNGLAVANAPTTIHLPVAEQLEVAS